MHGSFPALAVGLLLIVVSVVRADEGPADPVVLVVHGGAGVKSPKEFQNARGLREKYVDDLKKALEKGKDALDNGTPLDGVVAAIKVLEDSERFNAGKGAVFTNEGRNELDASIMEGTKKKAGAVAGVTNIKNPIVAARKVMDESKHVLLIGLGAERFAERHGVEIVSPVYFWTQERWDGLRRAIKEEEDEKKRKGDKSGRRPATKPYFGTVGAVALKNGRLAAGTSTGGLTNKRCGRVGDSPIIGAGTYADDKTCAVSCTGQGELFIRHAVAHDVSARMKYGKKVGVVEAANATLDELPNDCGGFIALDGKGNYAMPYNTEGMYRGTITKDGKITIWIYRDKEKID